MKSFGQMSLFLKKHIFLTISVTAILAIGTGYCLQITFLKPLVLVFTILIVYPMMIALPIKSIFTLHDSKTLVFSLCLNFAIVPFVGHGLGSLFLANQPELRTGLLLVALLPTSGGMTISWTGIANGNIQAATKMTVLGLLLGSLFAPFYLKLLLGKTITIPLLLVLKQIALIVFCPLVLGQITRMIIMKIRGEETFEKSIKPKLPELSKLGLIGLIFIAVALKARIIIYNPSLLLRIIVPVVLFYIINYVFVGYVGNRLFRRGDCIALVYGTALRSLSVALAMSMTVFGESGVETGLLIALAYIIQLQSAPLYGKFLAKKYQCDDRGRKR